ncbi:MAG: DUF349 domain-containing protein [Gammaproteobacteria bacterium]
MMSKQPDTVNLESRRAILDEIDALLDDAGGIDETRAKKVRKAVDALRGSGDTSAAGEDKPAADTGLDTEIDTRLETLRARVHKQVERRNRDYEKALGLMGQLETALGNNELQQAERINHSVLSIMGNIPGLSEQRWRDIEKRLNRVRPRLRKLESWRHWGTTQARRELIEQVAKLPETGLAPEKLARRIRQARDQWRTWDKSGDQADKALWKAFDQACEEAYKPCSAHFEKLRQQRAENLEKRRAVIDALNARFAATDWKAPDWRDIERFIRHARRDYYKIGNVDFKHRKPLARALDEALEPFEDHLAQERARSLRSREKLIADIKALGEVADLRAALERLETLKKQWRITVVGKRALENKLWKRFQASCDATYRRRDAEYREQDAERNENLKQKQALIEELARTAAAADEELLASASVFARVHDRWQEIGPVPRKHEKGLEGRWRETRKRFRKALAAAESRTRTAELDNLARRAALCHRWEQAMLAGNSVDQAGARAEWEALPGLSGASAEAIERRFAQAFSRPDATTLSSNLALKQSACLKLEVMLDLESPPDCQSERMAYQVERLNASLQKDDGALDSPAELLPAALVTGAVPAEAAAVIEQRLLACLARYRNRS